MNNKKQRIKNSKKKYKNSERGKLNNRFNRRINKWKNKRSYVIDVEFNEFLKFYEETKKCTECGQLFKNGNNYICCSKVENSEIAINDIKLICKDCFLETQEVNVPSLLNLNFNPLRTHNR